MKSSQPNPLLDVEGLPPFSRIRPEHVVPAVEQLIERGRDTVRVVLEHGGEHDWDSLVTPIEDADDALYLRRAVGLLEEATLPDRARVIDVLEVGDEPADVVRERLAATQGVEAVMVTGLGGGARLIDDD